ncbi:MAG: DegV family protein [Acidimicrobiales bacterium]
MSGVRVVTDSGCDLTDELAAANAVTIVPLTIRFGDEELLDRRDITPSDFWRRCRSSAALPQTAAPSPGAFQSAYEQAASDGADAVVCLTISSRVSGTYQSALAGAESLSGRVPVQVIDTKSVTMGEGLLCLAAAAAAPAGSSADEVVALVEDMIPRTRVYGVVGTLDHLQRGGRIGGAAALLGSLLSIKPVIQVSDGLVEQESKQRTRARALAYLASKPRGDAPLERLAVCDGAASDIDAVVSSLSDIPVAHDLVVADLGPVVGTHAGPETIGICYLLPAS